jgi:integrase
MSKIIKLQNNKYRITYQDPDLGKQVKRVITGKSRAEQYFNRVNSIIDASKLQIEIPRKFNNNYTLEKLSNEFLAFVKSNRSEGTYKRYQSALSNLMRHFSKTLQVENVNIEMFKDGNSHRQPSGINGDLRAIKSAFSWAIKRGKIKSEPVVSYYRTAQKKINVLSDEDIKTLINTAKGDTKNLVRFYLLTGARISEPLQKNFTWSDVDFMNNRIAMTRKGNKKSWASVSQSAIDILYNWMDRESPIPYTDSYVRNRFEALRDETGIQFTAHDLRKASGAILLRQGASIFHVSKFLDHTSVDITVKYYVDLLNEEKRELYESVATHLDSIVSEV